MPENRPALKSTVRNAYSKIALDASGFSISGITPEQIAKIIGYTDDQLDSLPEGSNLGLGCGNPLAFALIKPGDTVLDLGSGAGIDCFIAAQEVGRGGFVIGVDMTPEMIRLANKNKRYMGLTNVEFREGAIEALPVQDNTIDVIISNCVINLVSNRDQVYKEASRVLKPGGQVVVSDTIQTMELPHAILDSEIAKASCISAEVTRETYMTSLRNAGLTNVAIASETPYPSDLGFEEALLEGLRDQHDIPEQIIRDAAHSIVAILITAKKPIF